MSADGKSTMARKIIHRSYNCLVLDYADGERVTIRDVERIRWVLTECEILVSFSLESIFSKNFMFLFLVGLFTDLR